MSSTNENIADRPWGATGSAFSIGGSIASTIAAWFDALKTWRAYRRDVARLEVMGEGMLRDIGISRAEIGHVVRFGRNGA